MAKPTIKTNTAPEQKTTKTQNVPAAPEMTEVKPIPYDLQELTSEYKTKSGVIRFLAAEGFTRGQIAKFMNIKYQFVRNVLITTVKKADE